MKTDHPSDAVRDAANELLESGVVALEGTKTPACQFADKIVEWLSDHPEVSPVTGYQEVHHAGYLYYLVDTNRFGIASAELKERIDKLDAANPHEEGVIDQD